MQTKRDSRDQGRRWLGFAVGGAVVVAIAAAGFLLSGGDPDPPRRVQEFMIVNIPPPPPPPPPEVQPPPEQQMVEQPKMVEPEIKQEKPVEQPKDEKPNDSRSDEPPGPLALDADAKGPGDMAAKKGGRPITGGGGGGSRWGWYATMVQTQLEQALRSNPKTKNAVMQVQVRVWADSSGRISRIVLVSSTGSADVDDAIRNEVMAGIVLREPPPADMPMPMVTRITARRPT
ncbi:MAG: TonB C-terminal domain-containing protein [Rhodoplanes sp.]|uniref:TonB C-terminal domain-containing protein n=1 Tax=Rhodoplanes sp. TaxID=1968906 RepID=UPI00180A88FC|nr:TonB C-terminal domain-containing protein [Rhodoplanes sp.]NVO18004.1 TonB C-terminal domain-containing protein [Rhodoplanes sp.]